MALRKQNLSGQGQADPRPAIDPLTGLQTYLRAPAVEVMRGQDKIASLSRRVVLSVGLRGDTAWRTPNTNPASNSLTHPDRTTWYTLARARVDLTPGCYLRLVGACVPSGETQRAATAGEGAPAYRPDGVIGTVRITVTWHDDAAGTETTTREVELPGSTLTYGAEDTSVGGTWRTLQTFEVDEIVPPTLLANTTELQRFSRPSVATILIEVRGSPRIVDLSVHEYPVAVAFDSPDDIHAGVSTQHLYVTGDPDQPAAPLPRVAERHDLPAGTNQILRTARAQAERLGPVLAQWYAYTEDGAGPTSTSVARTTANDGTTYEALLNSSQTGTGAAAYDADLPGWSVSCGGYARRWASAGPLVLRDRIAVIPVLVRVYGRTVTAGTGTFRFQTAPHSYVDVAVPVAGANAWVSAYGWLEVGITPEQPVVGQALINHVGASGSLSVSAFAVHYAAIESVA